MFDPATLEMIGKDSRVFIHDTGAFCPGLLGLPLGIVLVVTDGTV